MMQIKITHVKKNHCLKFSGGLTKIAIEIIKTIINKLAITPANIKDFELVKESSLICVPKIKIPFLSVYQTKRKKRVIKKIAET